jgi:hypothetical protein
MNGGGERCIHGFGVETSGTDHLEDLDIDGRIILRRILKKWDGGHGLD